MHRRLQSTVSEHNGMMCYTYSTMQSVQMSGMATHGNDSIKGELRPLEGY